MGRGAKEESDAKAALDQGQKRLLETKHTFWNGSKTTSSELFKGIYFLSDFSILKMFMHQDSEGAIIHTQTKK